MTTDDGQLLPVKLGDERVRQIEMVEIGGSGMLLENRARPREKERGRERGIIKRRINTVSRLERDTNKPRWTAASAPHRIRHKGSGQERRALAGDVL